MKKVMIKLIEWYQKYVSPYLSQVLNIHCKFEPTCSEYTKQAINKYGAIGGIWRGFKRVIRCHPFSKGGYDPLK